MKDLEVVRVPTAPRSKASPDAPAGHRPTGYDPSRVRYRSQEYAMYTIDTGRDGDGAPISEVWTFANEDDPVEGYGWLEVRVHEVVATEQSGALAVYYRQWFAPDGEPAWGKRPKRQVGSLGSLKSLIRRRRMAPCDSDTHPQGGDSEAAPFMGSAGAQHIAHPQSVGSETATDAAKREGEA